MKGSTIILVLILISSYSFSQVRKQIDFNGFSMMEYERPILVSGNPSIYKAYYHNSGQSVDRGKIIIDEASKTFILMYINGDVFESKFTKKEIKNEHDQWLGDVERVIYVGKWIQDDADCSLVLTLTKSYGCVTTLNSRKVIDKDYGIETWKRIYTYGTSGDVLNEVVFQLRVRSFISWKYQMCSG